MRELSRKINLLEKDTTIDDDTAVKKIDRYYDTIHELQNKEESISARIKKLESALVKGRRIRSDSKGLFYHRNDDKFK